MKLRPLVIAVALVVPCPGEAARVSVDDLMKVRALADVALSPDGERVAYVVASASFERDAYEPALYLVSARGGAAVRVARELAIVNRPLPTPMLRWSPDGTRLAFLAMVNDIPQVAVLEVRGGTARAVTTATGGVRAYAWAPDAARVAYVAGDPESPEDEQRKKERTFVIHADRPDRPVRVWVQALGGGAPRALTPPAHYVEQLDWSPDGRTIVYSASSITGFMAQYDLKLYLVDADGGEPRALVARAGMHSTPRYAPDGRHVAFISTAGRTELKAPRALAVVETELGVVVSGPGSGETPSRPRITELTPDTWIGEFAWAPDSRSLFFIANEGTFGRREHMFEQPIARIPVGGGRQDQIAGGRAACYALTISRDGARIAYRSVGPTDVGDVYVQDLGNGSARRLTTVNPELAALDLAAPQPIRWTSFDGMEIWGLLLTPPGRPVDRRVPLIVYCHGGPIGGFTYGLFPQFAHRVGQVEPYPIQALASAGFAVLLPMPRGGSGYGERGHAMIVNAWGEADFKDIMAGVDHLIAQGLADPARLGVMGASYGGYLTSWIVTQTDRFKAASTAASVNDLTDMYYLSDAGAVMAEYFGTPWEHADAYVAHSPVAHAANVTTPLLIQHGETDQRVPVSLAWKFYRALKAHKKIVELDIYPRAGHVAYEPDMQREIMRRNLDWFVKWLGATVGSR